MEHVPKSGPVIFASNHRSFLDPFVIGTLTRRPVYYVAKKELFAHPVAGWLLNRLGAFPIDRGAGDQQAMETARRILERGDCVVIFPEGTRTRPGPLGQPRRGVGRLALQTGAPVVPVAVFGTEAVRRGWRIRPRKVTLRCGRALSFPRVENPTLAEAAAVTDRIWPCVVLQWDWLGGKMPERAQLPMAVARQRRPRCLLGGVRSVGGSREQPQGGARRGVQRVLSNPSARRLQLPVLPGRQPSRCRGPHGADVPAGLSTLRARAARVRRAAAAAVADPDRAQPRRESLSRPLAPAAEPAR